MRTTPLIIFILLLLALPTASADLLQIDLPGDSQAIIDETQSTITDAITDPSLPTVTIPDLQEQSQQELSGLVISYEPNSPMAALAKTAQDIISTLTPSGFMISPTGNHILIGDSPLSTGHYSISGFTISSIQYKGKTWTIFKLASSQRNPSRTVTFSELKNNPDAYTLKEISVKATIKEVSATVDLEAVKIPVSTGILTDKPADPFKFTEELLHSAKEYQENPSWEKAEHILHDYEGISVFRLEEGYWKTADAETTGYVLTPELLTTYFDLIYDAHGIRELLPSKGTVLLANDVTLTAEKTSISDIIQDAGKYNGKVVEVEINGVGSDISVKKVVGLIAASASSGVGGVGGVVIELAQRLNAYIQVEMIWTPTAAISGMDMMISTGTRSYRKGYAKDIMINPFADLRTAYILKGVVVSSSQFNESLPDTPMLIIFEKEVKSTALAVEVSGDTRDLLQEKLNSVAAVVQGHGVPDTPPSDMIQNAIPETATVDDKTDSTNLERLSNDQESTDLDASMGDVTAPGFESFLAIVALLILARVRD